MSGSCRVAHQFGIGRLSIGGSECILRWNTLAINLRQRDDVRNALILSAVMLVAACGGGYDTGSTPTGSVGGIQSITVSVTPKTALMAIGDRITLVATVSGGPTGSPRTVTWSSSDSSKATVNASGDVQAVAKGNIVVTATSTANTEKSAGAAITITP